MRSLEKRGLFDFELVCPTPLPTAAVVVVDPFSSGSILAARVLHYKLRLVMVFSEVRKGTGGGYEEYCDGYEVFCFRLLVFVCVLVLVLLSTSESESVSVLVLVLELELVSTVVVVVAVVVVVVVVDPFSSFPLSPPA